MIEVKEYSVYKMRKNGIPVQYFITVPLKFVRENNYPEKLLVVAHGDVIVLTSSNDKKKLIKILKAIIETGE